MYRKRHDLFAFVQTTGQTIKNYPDLDDFTTGMTIVDLITVKMRLSHKDLLLLIGILVAAIIAFTTLVYRDPVGLNKRVSSKSTVTSASLFVKKLLAHPI